MRYLQIMIPTYNGISFLEDVRMQGCHLLLTDISSWCARAELS